MKTTDRQPVRSRRRRRRAAISLLLVAGTAGWWRYLNYVPDISVPTPTMPSPNAYYMYVQAGDSLVDNGVVGHAIVREEIIRRQGLTPITPAQKAVLLEANAPALETLRQGFGFPYQHPPVRSFDAALPNMAKFRSMARLLTLEAQMHEANGRYADSANSYLDAMRMGADIPRGGSLISLLVGIACEAIGRRPLWPLTEKLNADEARDAARRMEQITARRVPLHEVFREEKWGMQAGVSDLLRKNNSFKVVRGLSGFNPDAEAKPAFQPAVLAMQARMLVVPKRRVLDGLSAHMDAQIKRASRPYARRGSSPPIPEDPINKVLLPILDGAFLKEASTQAENGLLTVVLALRAFRAERGDYPRSLEELATAGYLTKVPDDAFAPTAAPPVYRRLSADKYLLYSLGPDGADDGGKPVPDPRNNNQPRRWVVDGDRGDLVVGVNLY